MSLRISLVINTYNRMHTLPRTLESLEYLRYPELEVIVVDGPSTDGTEEYVRSHWGDRVKFARCPMANLAVSRNIGLALAAGDIVAFTDDDGIPEPDWLDELAAAYNDPAVAAAGGFVRDHSGVAFQAKYIASDRHGNHDQLIEHAWEQPEPAPGAFRFPRMIGVNSSFRRKALMAAGGFDEEYAYCYDEVDPVLRLLDAGWRARTVPTAEVHHKYAASDIRREDGLPRSWLAIMRSTAYFCVRNALPGTPLNESFFVVEKHKRICRSHTEWAARLGKIDAAEKARLLGEIEAGAAEGVRDVFAHPARRLAPPAGAAPAWLPFRRRLAPAERLRLALVTPHYPPRKDIGGVGIFMVQLARQLAASGHEITVITRGEAGRPHTVDFEERVWVHRLPDNDATDFDVPGMPPLPDAQRRAACGTLAELERVAQRRRFDWVIGTIWGLDLAAVIASRRFPVAMYLVTTYGLMLDDKPEWKADTGYYTQHVEKMIAAERWALERADRVLASTQAILADTERAYGLRLESERVALLPFGIDPPRLAEAAQETSGRMRLLFVGRFETRKGIDVLLECLPGLLARHPGLEVYLAGDDSIPAPRGGTFKSAFYSRHQGAPWLDRVHCLGFLPEAELEREYRDCDIFVAPSRYESFGLIYLEAMRYGKPCVGCRAGGIPEIVSDDETGLLAEPGNAVSLEQALERLIGDSGLRRRLGKAGREWFETHFTVEHFARRLADSVMQWRHERAPA